MRIPNTDYERALLWNLYDLVKQNLYDCTKSNGYELFSGFIRANATALRLLEEYGMIDTIDPDKGTDTPEWTRCVEGHALEQEEIVKRWERA